MLQISGKVVNLFTVEGGRDKDGKEYDERHKVQLLGNIALPNGGSKYDLMDLTVEDLGIWQNFKGKDITIPIGAFAPSKGNIVYFVSKGAKPVPTLVTA